MAKRRRFQITSMAKQLNNESFGLFRNAPATGEAWINPRGFEGKEEAKKKMQEHASVCGLRLG